MDIDNVKKIAELAGLPTRYDGIDLVIDGGRIIINGNGGISADTNIFTKRYESVTKYLGIDGAGMRINDGH